MWEDVYSEEFDIMERLQIDGGWLYRNRYVTSGVAQNPGSYVWQVSMAFAPGELQAPLNTAVPFAQQQGDTLECTMGEWIGTPTAYAFEWQIDGAAVATDNPLALDGGGVGQSFTCIVTATNAAGSTAAPPSNAVVVVAP